MDSAVQSMLDEASVIINGEKIPVKKVGDRWEGKDKNGNVFSSASKEGLEQKKPSKLDAKRAQMRQEHRQRLLNKGIPPEKVDAVMAQELYEALPLEKKFKRLESLISQTIQRLAKEMSNLRYNDGVLADSMDLNFKVFGRILEKLGMSPEQQKEIVVQVENEMREERMKQEEAESQASKLKADQEEKARMEVMANEANAITSPKSAGDEAQTEAREDATTFGG